MTTQDLRTEILKRFGSVHEASKAVGVSHVMIHRFIGKGYVPPSYIEPLGIDPSFSKSVAPGRKTGMAAISMPATQKVNVSQLSIEEAQRVYRELHAIFGAMA